MGERAPLTLPQTTTPEALAKHMGWSERRVRDLARSLGACRILGNRMTLLPADVAAIKAAVNEGEISEPDIKKVGYVYFVKSNSFIKIGWSANWQNRITNIQTSIPERLEVLAVYARSISFEKRLHGMFAPFRHRPDGEWFRDCEAIRTYIAERKRYCLVKRR